MGRISLGVATISAVVAVVLVGAGPVSSAAPNVCVSVNGIERVQKGSAACGSVESEGAANVAISTGDHSYAQAGSSAGDSGNRARASGDHSLALATDGHGNTAVATGDNSAAGAQGGNRNRAVVTGDRSLAVAGLGDGNTAIATRDECEVFAEGDGVIGFCEVATDARGARP